MIIIGNAVTKGQPSPKAGFAFLLIDLEVVGEKLEGITSRGRVGSRG